MRLDRTLTVAILLAAAGTPALAQITLRPGEYEQTMEIQLPGAPPTTQKDLNCVTAEQAKDMGKYMAETMAKDLDFAQNCKSATRTVGSTITIDSVCTVEGTKTAAKTVVTFTADSYTMHMTMDLGGQPSTWKGSAKWVRATCTEGGR